LRAHRSQFTLSALKPGETALVRGLNLSEAQMAEFVLRTSVLVENTSVVIAADAGRVELGNGSLPKIKVPGVTRRISWLREARPATVLTRHYGRYGRTSLASPQDS